MDDKNLMDDVELFVNDKTKRKPSTALNDLYKSPTSASSDLRDVFIFNNDPKPTSTFLDDVPTDNLLGFTDWTAAGDAGKLIEDTHDWPELPSVSVENYVRSSRSSSSTTIDNHFRRESLDKVINHVPLLPPRPSFKDQTSSNNVNAAVPPRINRATTSKTPHISNGKLANGDANHVLYKNNHNQLTNNDRRRAKNFDVVDDDDDEEEIDEDDVFFGYESTKPLINVNNNNHKKKVRFLDGSRVSSEQTEMNIGGSGGDALIVKRGRTCRYAMIRFGYLMIGNAVLAAIVCALIYLPPMLKSKRNLNISPPAVVQCKRITIEYNDNFTFQQYFPTSDVKIFNLTNDRRLCVAFGFGLYGSPCDSNRQNCQRRGGVLAFDLTNGKELWKLFTADEILGVNCQEDVDGDRIVDCAVGGRSGILKMISGVSGAVIWEFQAIAGRYRDVLTPQWVSDASGDGIADILATVDVETDDNVEMTLYLLSGKTGQSLSETDNVVSVRSMKSENPALVWRHGDVALEEIVWASGTLKLTGGLSIFSLRALKLGKIEENQILYTNASIISQPTVVDLNGDGFKDLVVCSLSGEVIAYSGALPHKILWIHFRPQSQCSSLIVVGSFENDTCPDLIVTFNVGDGFPNYKFFETKILNGRTGVESERLFTSTLPVASRWTAIKMTGVGNDIILTFKFGCTSGLPSSLDARFSSLSAPQSLRELSNVDYCNQLFDSKRSYELFAARKSFSTSLFSSSSGSSKLFDKSPQFNDWVTQNGLDAENLLMQIGQMIALNVSSDGSALSILIPTYISSASDIIVFPKECFANPREFMGQRGMPEKCRRFVGGRQKRKIENAMMSGFTVLNRVTVRCDCDQQQLKKTETCSKFLPV